MCFLIENTSVWHKMYLLIILDTFIFSVKGSQCSVINVSVSYLGMTYLFNKLPTFNLIQHNSNFQITKYMERFFLMEIQLIYNIMLVSGVQRHDSVIYIQKRKIYIFLFRFFSLIGYYKILSIVPCAIQQVLVGYLLYI